MAAAQHVLEKAKEDLNRPAMNIDEGDDLGRHVKQIGGDPQDPVASGPRRAPFVFAAAGVLTDLNSHEADRMIGPGVSLFVPAECYELVAEHIQRAVSIAERTLFQDFINA